MWTLVPGLSAGTASGLFTIWYELLGAIGVALVPQVEAFIGGPNGFRWSFALIMGLGQITAVTFLVAFWKNHVIGLAVGSVNSSDSKRRTSLRKTGNNSESEALLSPGGVGPSSTCEP